MTEVYLPPEGVSGEDCVELLNYLIEKYIEDKDYIHYRRVRGDHSPAISSRAMNFFHDIGLLLKRGERGEYKPIPPLVKFYSKTDEPKEKARRNLVKKLDEDCVFHEFRLLLKANKDMELDELLEDASGNLDVGGNHEGRLRKYLEILEGLGLVEMDENDVVSTNFEVEEIDGDELKETVPERIGTEPVAPDVSINVNLNFDGEKVDPSELGEKIEAIRKSLESGSDGD